MDHQFWHDKWNNNDIGFHQSAPNPWLISFWFLMKLQPGDRVFVPLCGKTRDIDWLLSQGYHVVGSELNEQAARKLFGRLMIEPKELMKDGLLCLQSINLEVIVGDFFKVDKGLLGSVKGTFDRAALVALPEVMRKEYSVHLLEISAGAPQILITFEYPQEHMAGPPFAVCSEEIERLYSGSYDLNILDEVVVPGGLKHKCPAIEKAWHLVPKSES